MQLPRLDEDADDPRDQSGLSEADESARMMRKIIGRRNQPLAAMLVASVATHNDFMPIKQYLTTRLLRRKGQQINRIPDRFASR